MKKVEIKSEHLIWPDKCAYCCAPASYQISMKSKAVQKVGYFIMFFLTTQRVIQISFPVCKKHRLRAFLAAKISQRNFLNLTLGVFSVFAMLGPLGDVYRFLNNIPQPEVDLAWHVSVYLYPALYWFAFFWAKNNTPVIIEDLKGKVSFYFKNEAYGREFERLNLRN